MVSFSVKSVFRRPKTAKIFRPAGAVSRGLWGGRWAPAQNRLPWPSPSSPSVPQGESPPQARGSSVDGGSTGRRSRARFPDEFTLFSRSPSWSWRLQFGQWHGHYRSALAGSGPAKILPGVLSVAPALECRVVVGLGGSCACARREDCHATSGGRLIAARSNEASSRACTRGHACACTCR